MLGLLLFAAVGLGLVLVWGAYRIAQHSRDPIERLYSGASPVQKRPIVLVHGLNRSGRMWAAADDGHGNPIPGAASMVESLKANGYPNIYLNTFSDTRNTSLLDNAKTLKKWVDTAKRRFGAERVDIITHSMGALIARAYLQEMDRKDGKRTRPIRFEKDVANLIMIAAPHLGSPLADSIPSFINWYARRLLLEGGGPDLRRLNSLPLPCESNYHSILISAAPGRRRRWGFWRLVRYFIAFQRPIDGDGTVSLRSQNLERAADTGGCGAPRHFAHFLETEPGIRHRDATQSSAVQRKILEILGQNVAGGQKQELPGRRPLFHVSSPPGQERGAVR